MPRGLLAVISGPSGVGKGTIVDKVMELMPDLKLSISVTTRPKRDTEREGVHYFFISEQEFEDMVREGKLLEYVRVFGTCAYGTPREYVERELAAGNTVVLEIDIQGASMVRRNYPEAVMIFLAPPTMEELFLRLSRRNTETPEQVANRYSRAVLEIETAYGYDYVIINDNIDECAKKVCSVLQAESLKVSRNTEILDKILGREAIDLPVDKFASDKG